MKLSVVVIASLQIDQSPTMRDGRTGLEAPQMKILDITVHNEVIHNATDTTARRHAL